MKTILKESALLPAMLFLFFLIIPLDIHAQEVDSDEPILMYQSISDGCDNPRQAILKDINEDGFDDRIVICGEYIYAHITRIGRTPKIEVIGFNTGGDIKSIAFGTFNDVNEDALIFTATGGTLKGTGLYYAGKGFDGEYADPSTPLMAAQHPGHVAIGDIDGNGHDDIVYIDNAGINATLWVAPDNDPSFFSDPWRVVITGVLTDPYTISVEDFDQDGTAEILVVDRSGEVRLWTNDGNGGSLSSILWKGVNTLFHGTADFDLDGYQDVWIAESSGRSGSIIAFRNEGGTINWDQEYTVSSFFPGMAEHGGVRNPVITAYVNRDAYPDIMFAYESNLYWVQNFGGVFNFDFPLWVDTDQGNLIVGTGVTFGSGDMNGDGVDEIYFSDSKGDGGYLFGNSAGIQTSNEDLLFSTVATVDLYSSVTNHKVTIQFDRQETIRFMAVDMLGSQVISPREITIQANTPYHIEVGNLPSGKYLLRMVNGDAQRWNKEFIVVK